MRRRRRQPLLALAGAADPGRAASRASPLAGHPDHAARASCATPLVGDKQTQVVREAIDKVHDRYYRAIPEDQLADAAISGIVALARTTASPTTSPRRSTSAFRSVTDAAYAGVGMEVATDPEGLRVVTRLRRLARQAGGHPRRAT